MKREAVLLIILILFGISGCGSHTHSTSLSEGCTSEESETKIAKTYMDIYEKAVGKNTLGSLEEVQNIVNRLGEYGYAAVDRENQNQVNMVHPELIEQFCKQVNEKQDAKVTLLSVMEDGGFIRFDLKTFEGKVYVTRSVLTWDEGVPKVSYQNSYQAYTWTYTENGYLFFEEYLPPGYDGAPGYTAIRVKPLDEKCRQLNRRYILPIGYAANNMFLSDWTEKDFATLNFYDLFAIFYPFVYGRAIPYEQSVAGEEYRVPKEEFEKVILSYFNIDAAVLRTKTSFSQQEQIYAYRTRGFNDCAASPNMPYPEVVSCDEKEDGTIKLTVNVVWPKKSLEKAFCHEVIIRPLEDGSFRYVSNHVIPSEENEEPTWYAAKLREEEKGYHLPVERTAREEAEMDCKAAMERMLDIYSQAEKGSASNVVISDQTAIRMLEILKETKCPVTVSTFPCNMENYEKMEAFLMDSLHGKKGEMVTYQIHASGGIGRVKYIFDGTDMYALCTNAAWSEKNTPVVTLTSYSRIKEWQYTKKGWFQYEYCMPEPPEVTEVMNGNTMIRVKPLEEEALKLAEQFLSPLGYQGNNLLCSDWDAEHMEGIDYDGLFEYLHFIKYGQTFQCDTDTNGIPKEEFESLLTAYLPVTAEQLEQFCAYDAESQTYTWEMLGCGTYVPNAFGTSVPEIIDSKVNQDGTTTLTVDAVCEMLGKDALISHKLTVRLQENGGIRYLGNQILNDGLKNIPEYQYRNRQIK